MKKALFSALTLALLYGCASTPVEPEKPAEPSVQTPAAPVAPPLAARPVQPAAPQVDLSKRSVFYERSEEHTSELQSQSNLVCRLLLEKKKKHTTTSRLQNTTSKQFTSVHN